MKIRASLFLALALALPSSAFGQDRAAVQGTSEPAPPAGLAAAEASRSRRCVPILARLDTLDARMAPFAARAERLQRLDQAILFEDSTKAAPFDARDSVEVAVRTWFATDQALARRYAESGDSAIAAARDAGRETIRKRLMDAMSVVSSEGRATVEATGDLELDARECEGMILVRSVVREACGTATIPVCRAALDTARSARFPFVDGAGDLWDVESVQPWVQPGPFGLLPEGGLGGAQTGTVERIGNLSVTLSLQPTVRERARMEPPELARLEGNLDSIGVKHRHPRYVLSPTIAVDVEVAEPLAAETHYFLHFGDLSNPARDLIWTSAAIGHPLHGELLAGKGVLDRLAAGEAVTLTAVRFADPEQKQAQAVYSVPLTQVGQALSVSKLVDYLRERLGDDFSALVPADAG